MNIAILGATGKFGITFTTKLLAVTNHKLKSFEKSRFDLFCNIWRLYSCYGG